MFRFFSGSGFRACPHCGWEICVDAVKCRYCGQFVDRASSGKGEACWLCRIVAAVLVVLLLAGAAAFVYRAGGL